MKGQRNWGLWGGNGALDGSDRVSDSEAWVNTMGKLYLYDGLEYVANCLAHSWAPS